MLSYYNEIDPYAAQWLRNLIACGRIPVGFVDERSIEDVHPDDLRGFTQCHFFAGIGGWSYALRLAGWPDDRPVWTGSCPCQPFSTAGKGTGFADERHLWPAFFHLIEQCKPSIVFGEQVASKDGLDWLDLVSDDLEGSGYAFGAADLCAAGVGAPHIRQRLYWVADSSGARLEGRDVGAMGNERQAAERGCCAGGLADADRWQCDRLTEHDGHERDGAARGWFEGDCQLAGGGKASRAGPTNGHWRTADWLACRDGKWRPVEPGTQQMVDGVSRGMGLLRTNIEAWEKVDDATKAIGLAEQVVQALRYGHGAEAIWRSLGRRLSLPEATLLLATVCQQQGELGRVFDGSSARSPQEREDALRALRVVTSSAPSSPQGRKHPEQLAWQLGDAMPELSQAHPPVLRVIDGLRQFTGSPLAHGIPGRVGRVRGYGNAIVPQVAAAFIGAVT